MSKEAEGICACVCPALVWSALVGLLEVGVTLLVDERVYVRESGAAGWQRGGLAGEGRSGSCTVINGMWECGNR